MEDIAELARQHNEDIIRKLDINNDGKVSHNELGKSKEEEPDNFEDVTIVLF